MPGVILGCLLAIVAMPTPAHAWGFDAHQFIVDRAIALLPAELRPFFEKNRATVVERAIDPDTWIIAGFTEEGPSHFLDIDWDGYGKYPFAGLPHAYDDAVAKFGKARVDQNGTLPWRTEEVFGNLRRAFEQYPRGDQYGFNQFAIVLQAATLAHYTSDAHVPLHGVVNYTGQLTGQNGLHQRWENSLFERYRDRYTISPKPIPAVTSPREFVFDRLLEDTQLVPALLQADLDAIGSRDTYDTAYYESMLRAQGPALERRLNESIAAVAAMIAGAWEVAGKPALPLEGPRTPQRRRRP